LTLRFFETTNHSLGILCAASITLDRRQFSDRPGHI
jgi:hypothetical protein